MRQIPECAPVPKRLQGRRWWQSAGAAGSETWRRRDGLVARRSYMQTPGRTVWEIAGVPEAFNSPLEFLETHRGAGARDDEGVLAVLDSRFPLPFPGLYEGQVWLFEAKNAFFTALFQTPGIPGGTFTSADMHADMVIGYLSNKPLRFSQSRDMEKGKIAVSTRTTFGFSRKVLLEAYLLSDPVAPERAPWSGT